MPEIDFDAPPSEAIQFRLPPGAVQALRTIAERQRPGKSAGDLMRELVVRYLKRKAKEEGQS